MYKKSIIIGYLYKEINYIYARQGEGGANKTHLWLHHFFEVGKIFTRQDTSSEMRNLYHLNSLINLPTSQ